MTEATRPPKPLPLPGAPFMASPSSIAMHRGKGGNPGCPRQWAARYCAKIEVPFPEGPRAFGTRYHAIAEAWLLSETVPDQTTPEGRLFTASIPYLPRPRTCRAEGKSKADDASEPVRVAYDGVTIWGYVDFDFRAARLFGDHKTFGPPGRYNLNTRTLPEDVQFLAYSEAFLEAWPEASEIRGRWNYANKSTRVVTPVEAVAKRAPQRLAVLQNTLDAVRAIKDTWTGDINDVPAVPAVCQGVGRNCDYAKWCKITKPGVIPMPKSIEELKAELAARKAGQTPAAAQAAAVSQVAAGTGGAPEAAAQAPAVAAEMAAQAPAPQATPPAAPEAPAAKAPAKPKAPKPEPAAAPVAAQGVQGIPLIDGTQLLREGRTVVVKVSLE